MHKRTSRSSGWHSALYSGCLYFETPPSDDLALLSLSWFSLVAVDIIWENIWNRPRQLISTLLVSLDKSPIVRRCIISTVTNNQSKKSSGLRRKYLAGNIRSGRRLTLIHFQHSGRNDCLLVQIQPNICSGVQEVSVRIAYCGLQSLFTQRFHLWL